MGLFKDFMANAAKEMISIGDVASSDFPVGTIINLTENEEDASMTFTLPDKSEYVVTHDKVKNAEFLAMGVIDIEQNGNATTYVYGTKYKIALVDGKVAVLTVGLGRALYRIEHILF